MRSFSVVLCLFSAVLCNDLNAQGFGRFNSVAANANIIRASGFGNLNGIAANANIIRASSGVDPLSAVIYGSSLAANANSMRQFYGQRNQGYCRPQYRQQQVYYGQNAASYSSPYQQQMYQQLPAGPVYAPVYGGNNPAAHQRHAQEVNDLYRRLGYQDGVGGFNPSTSSSPNIAPPR